MYDLRFRFVEVYERAVQSVLNIQPFSEDITKPIPSPLFTNTSLPYNSISDKMPGETSTATLNHLHPNEPPNPYKDFSVNGLLKPKPFSHPNSAFQSPNGSIGYGDFGRGPLSDHYRSPMSDFSMRSPNFPGQTPPQYPVSFDPAAYSNFFNSFLSEKYFRQSPQNLSPSSYQDFPWFSPSPFYKHLQYAPRPNMNWSSNNGDVHRPSSRTETASIKKSPNMSKSSSPNISNKSESPSSGCKVSIKKEPKLIKQESSTDEDLPPPKRSRKEDRKLKKEMKNKSDDDVSKINCTSSIKDDLYTPNGKKTPSQDKKSKPKSLKYRPYRLRKRQSDTQLEKAQEALRPKYVLKEMHTNICTPQEMFLGELGLRRILSEIKTEKIDDKAN